MAGWIWGLFGLGLGLSVAAAIYMKDREIRPAPAAARQPERQAPAPAAKIPDEPKEERFQFYRILPKFEVVIPEEDKDPIPDVDTSPVHAPGIYVLQAGSFSSYADADRMKAHLALLGVVSAIQKVTVDDTVYHRVRIGPIKSLDVLNRTRQRLQEAQVEVLMIKVGG